jgi:hypothetical protein
LSRTGITVPSTLEQEQNHCAVKRIVIPTGGTRFCVPQWSDLKFLSPGKNIRLLKQAMNFEDGTELVASMVLYQGTALAVP